MKNLIYIPVNGIGLGHARRSLRIAEALSKCSEIVFSTYKNTPAFNYLKQSKFRVIGIPTLGWVQSPDGGLDTVKTLMISPYGAGIAISHLLIERYLIKHLSPRIVISDMRAAPIMISTKLGIPCFMLGLFFDLKREIDNFLIRQPARLLGGFIRELALKCEKTFVTDFPPPYTLYERVLPERIPSNYVFTGPIADKELEKIIREEDIFEAKRRSRKKLNISENEKVVLFLPSGVKESRLFFINGVIKILHELKKLNKIHFIISMGLIEKGAKIFRFKNIEIWNWIPNLTDYLLSADVIVGYYGMNKVFDAIAAGSLFLGKVANNQIEQLALAKKMRELGIGDLFNSFDKDLIPKLLCLLEKGNVIKTLSKYNKMIRQMDPINNIINYLSPYLD